MAARNPVVYVPEFEGLRGFLAAWVCLTHILCWSGFASVNLTGFLARTWATFIFAQPAVEIFIILSGFAIASLLDQKKPSYRNFLKGRFFRIFPVYVVCLLIGAAVSRLTPFVLGNAAWNDSIYYEWNRALSNSELSHPWFHFASHLTLLHGLLPKSILPDSTGTFLPPAWSISLEWQFYLVAPFLIKFIRSATAWIFIGVAAVLGARYGHYWENPHAAFFPAQFSLFLIGIGCFFLHKTTSLPNANCLHTSALALASITIISVIGWHVTTLSIWTISYGCVASPAGGVVERAFKVARRFLLNSFIQKLGRVSYSLYLLHWPVIIALLSLLLRVYPNASSIHALLFLTLVGLPALGALTFLLNRHIESPFMRIGKAATNNGLEVRP